MSGPQYRLLAATSIDSEGEGERYKGMKDRERKREGGEHFSIVKGREHGQ